MVTQSRQSQRPPVLVTRPPDQSERFAAAIRSRFGQTTRIVISPVSGPVFLTPRFQARAVAELIFTSETGVAAFTQLSNLTGVTAWCVGDETALAARKAGFQTRSAQGNAEKLAWLIESEGAVGPLLHVRGQDTTGNLAARLTSAGIKTSELIAYAQKAMPLNDEAIHLLATETPVVVPVFSPKSVVRLAEAVARADVRPTLWVAAISPPAMASAHALSPARHATAAHPNAEALLDAMSDLFDTDTQP